MVVGILSRYIGSPGSTVYETSTGIAVASIDAAGVIRDQTDTVVGKISPEGRVVDSNDVPAYRLDRDGFIIEESTGLIVRRIINGQNYEISTRIATHYFL